MRIIFKNLRILWSIINAINAGVELLNIIEDRRADQFVMRENPRMAEDYTAQNAFLLGRRNVVTNPQDPAHVLEGFCQRVIGDTLNQNELEVPSAAVASLVEELWNLLPDGYEATGDCTASFNGLISVYQQFRAWFPKTNFPPEKMNFNL